MPFLLRRDGGVRAFRYRFADDAGVVFCNTTTGGPIEGSPCGGVRISHDLHLRLKRKGRVVQVPSAIYEEHRRARSGERAP